MLTASGSLITAIKNSLADGAVGWAVVSVSEKSQTRVASVSGSVSGSTTGSTTGTITGGEGEVTGSTSGSVTGSTSSTPTTEVVTLVGLTASHLPISVGATTRMRINYESHAADGAFAYGVLEWNNSQYRSTDSALNTTIMALATAFVTPGDAALIAVLNAGPQTSTAIPAGLLSAIAASLAGSTAGWAVKAVNPTHLPDGSTQTTVIVNSTAGIVTVVDGNGTAHKIPSTISYLYTISALGTLVDAAVIMNGARWATTDSALAATMTAMASAFLAAQGTSLATALASV